MPGKQLIEGAYRGDGVRRRQSRGMRCLLFAKRAKLSTWARTRLARFADELIPLIVLMVCPRQALHPFGAVSLLTASWSLAMNVS
jgi:hypothetical protein